MVGRFARGNPMEKLSECCSIILFQNATNRHQNPVTKITGFPYGPATQLQYIKFSLSLWAGISIEQPTRQDFFDTAHVIDTLDVVISVDTAVVHLAASQGVDTWILLASVADWRWLHPSEQIIGCGRPWYPRARIFRQQKLPDGRSQSELWEPVITEAAHALSATTDSRNCNCEQPSSLLPPPSPHLAGGPASAK